MRAGMSGAQLTRSAGVTQQTMATVLTGLEGEQLIARQPSPVHGKVMIAALTQQGQHVLNRAY
jgi:MarR family transcriptional regulator, organic hydroperoxide resistance regulator